MDENKTEQAMVIRFGGVQYYSPHVVVEDLGDGRYDLTPLVPWEVTS